MLRLKLLSILYDKNTVDYLLRYFDTYTVDRIGSYLVTSYTLDNDTYNKIRESKDRDTFYYFKTMISRALDTFDDIHDIIPRIRQCEYLFRCINMYYPIVKPIQYNTFVTNTKHKIKQLKSDSMQLIHKEEHLIRHNINTRLNKRQRQHMEQLCIHIEKFSRESNECSIHLNSINHPIIWI